jgi:superfamily II DNA/RNA helicase
MPADSSAVPESELESGAESGPVERATTFAALGVPASLVEALANDGITTPFPVQAATLPDALAGRDILGRAQTGSGKTLGFSLPLVSRLAGGPTLAARPRGLVLVPTRELAVQVTDVLRPLAWAMGLRVATIYGGVSYGPQVNALQRRTDIVVATPGRLADLIGQGECNLSDVEVTVIDEADQMADLGFLPMVRQMLEMTPDGGQRMLFSATLDAAVDVLARQFLHDPVLHSVDENSSPAEIEHHLITAESSQKIAIITALAGGDKRSLVFTRTKHGAERLARQLTQAGIPAAELHGNLAQGARSRNLAAFASGLARVMVATDIAARGIHIDGIDLVIHADPPTEHKAYVHRSGRTARGGADGVVVTLQIKSQVRDVTAMMRKAGITPHEAVAADADAPVLAELAGPPAPRVTVDRKVAELVKPEDRLARNDRSGKPWEGRPRKGPGRERKPRDDRFRDRAPRDGAARDEAPRNRDEFASRDSGSSRPARADRGAGERRFGDRDSGARDFSERDYPRRDSGSRDSGNRDSGNRDAGGRGYARRDSGSQNGNSRYGASQNSASQGNSGRDFGNRGSDQRPGRRDEQGGGNDWWPRPSGARPAWTPRRPGASPGPGGAAGSGRRDDRAQDSRAQDSRAQDNRAQDSRGRDDRGRGDREFGTGRPARGLSGRPQARNQGRPQESGHPGGSARHPGYSAGRGGTGQRRESGQGRHY